MRYFVTGAQGFTGRFLVAEILAKDDTARVFGSGRSRESVSTFTHDVSWQGQHIRAPLTDALRSIDRSRYEYIECALDDERRLSSLVAQAAPDVVIHLASALRDDRAEILIKSNISGTAALFNSLSQMAHKPLVIFGSSGSVYGTPERLPLDETDRCAPFEPYAMSKFAAEFVARIMSQSASIPTIWARIFNIAGPGQEERHVCGRFAAQVAAIVTGHQSPIIEVGDLRPKRDFIDVRDVASAIYALSSNGVPGETYNVASGSEIAISEILGHTMRQATVVGGISLVERYERAADVPRVFASTEKLKARGFTRRFTIERTIADLVDYYLIDVAAAAKGIPVTSATSPSEIGIPSSQG